MNTLNNLDVILGFQLVMGLPEIIICELGALILGFTIHFFWNSKKSTGYSILRYTLEVRLGNSYLEILPARSFTLYPRLL